MNNKRIPRNPFLTHTFITHIFTHHMFKTCTTERVIMVFREDVEVLLTMESNVVEHTKGAEIGINKLVSTVSELRHLHTDKLELSYGS